MGIFSVFRKKNFSMPLLDKRPISVVINGVVHHFDPYNQTSKINDFLIDAYNDLSEVSSIINKIADFGSIVQYDILNERDEPITDERIIKLLNQPNKQQSWQEYYRECLIYYLLFGQSFENAFGYITPNSNFELKLLPPQSTKIELVNKSDFRNLQIAEYIVKIDGFGELAISNVDEVLHIKNSGPNFKKDQNLYGQSKLQSCIYNIESIRAGYGAKTGLYQSGPANIITGEPMGEFASANIGDTKEAVDRFQSSINNDYGMQKNQFKTWVTNVPLKVFKVSMNVRELMILENNVSDFQAIARAYDMDSRVLSDTSSSTYSNVEMALDSFLNGSFKNLIVNNAQQRALWLSKLFKKTIKLRPNFERIHEIIEKENEGNETILQMAKDGLITRNEALIRIGEEPVELPEYNKPFTYNSQNSTWMPIASEIDKPEEGVSQEQLQAQANLRGTVGGVEGILAIQNSVVSGITEYESGVAILREIFGFSDEIARQVLGTPNRIINTEQNGSNGQTTEIPVGAENGN